MIECVAPWDCSVSIRLPAIECLRLTVALRHVISYQVLVADCYQTSLKAVPHVNMSRLAEAHAEKMLLGEVEQCNKRNMGF